MRETASLLWCTQNLTRHVDALPFLHPTDECGPLCAAADEVPQHQGEKGDRWVYPSEQQFYTAMRRKGWPADPGDMPSIVAIHNGVNERAWHHILRYEARPAFEVRRWPCLPAGPADLLDLQTVLCAGYRHPTNSLRSMRHRRRREIMSTIGASPCTGAARGLHAQAQEIHGAAARLQPKGAAAQLPGVQAALRPARLDRGPLRPRGAVHPRLWKGSQAVVDVLLVCPPMTSL